MKIELEIVDANRTNEFVDKGLIGKDVYCIPLFRDSLSEKPYIGTDLVIWNGAWYGPDRKYILSLSHFIIVPIFPLDIAK